MNRARRFPPKPPCPCSGAARLSAEDIVRKHEVDAFLIIDSYNHNNNNVWIAAHFTPAATSYAT